MKKLLIALAALTISTAAEAQCRYVRPGSYLYISTRSNSFIGSSIHGVAACTRNTPALVLWGGGYMCVGKTFYGRTAQRQAFSCRVIRFGW